MIVVPSRTGIEHYMKFKEEIEEFVGRINEDMGKWGGYLFGISINIFPKRR